MWKMIKFKENLSHTFFFPSNKFDTIGKFSVYRYFISIILLISFSLVMQCVKPIWQKVDVAERQGNLSSAAAQLENYVRIHPNDGKAHYHLGEIYAKMDEWQKMVDSFNASEKVDSRWGREIQVAKELYWRQNYNTGLEEVNLGEFSSAINYFHNATIILPDRPVAYRLLGEANLETGNTDLAQSFFETTLKKDTLDQRARQHLMRIYYSAENYPWAIEQAKKLIKAVPANVEAVRIIAFSYDHLKDIPNAVFAYQWLINISSVPEDYEAFSAFQYSQGEYEQAIGLLRQAIQKGGDKIKNLRAVAQCQLMQQNFAALIETANEIIGLKSNDLAALQLLRISWAALGELERANSVSSKIKNVEAAQP